MYIHDVMHKRASICALPSWCLRLSSAVNHWRCILGHDTKYLWWHLEIYFHTQTEGSCHLKLLSMLMGNLDCWWSPCLMWGERSQREHACVRVDTQTHTQTHISKQFMINLSKMTLMGFWVDVNRLFTGIYHPQYSWGKLQRTQRDTKKRTILYIPISCTRNCNNHVNKMIMQLSDTLIKRSVKAVVVKKKIMGTSKEQ